MRVLVTGANGHLGCNVVRELLRRDHEVVGLLRSGADARGLAGLPVRVATGDVLDGTSVMAAAEGCDAIVNLAAVYQTGSVDHEAILRPAVDGIRHVLQAAAKRGMSRVVHTSSTVAIGTCDRPTDLLDETDWNERPFDAYYRAKTESEREAWRLSGELGVPLVCVNPSGILGAWDYRVTPTTDWVEQVARGEAQTVPGSFSFVDARDAAWMHAEALERGTPGERYLCTAPPMYLREAGVIIDDLTGRWTPHLPVPRWMVIAYAGMIERVDRFRGVRPRLVRTAAAEVAGRHARYDGSKSAAAFGFAPRDHTDMMREALRWAVFMGRLDPAGLRFDPSPDPAWVR